MANHAAETTDMGIGMAILFAAVAVVGSIAMVITGTEQQTVAAVGFAAAMLFASLSVAFVHLYQPR